MIKFKSFLIKILTLISNLNFDPFFFKKKKILVYDTETSQYYKNFFDKKKNLFSFNRIYSPISNVNFFVLTWSIINFFFYKNLHLSQIYSIFVIAKVKPKIIITFTDYDFFILNLKKFYPKIKIIIFQHQQRSNKILKKKNFKNKFIVDHVCVFGKNLKSYYSQFLNTSFKITGSIKNNFYKSNKKFNRKKKELLLISSFRPHINYFKEKVSNFQIQSLKNIYLFCQINKIKLSILPWAPIEENHKKYYVKEQEYYKKIFQGDNYKMLKKNHFIDSYNISSKFDYFVSHNSTLGYELLSRNYRVAIIRKEINYTSKNKNNLPVIDSLTSYRPKGYIWTDSCEKRETFRVLNNIIGISKTRNKHFINKYVNPIMMHDFQCENNFKFLKSIGFKVKKNVYSK